MNRPKFHAGDLARGSVLAAVFLAAAFALARFGFRNDYYFAILIPIAMMGCLLVSWGLYLKDDGFIKQHATAGKRSNPGELSVPRPGDPLQTSDMRAGDHADSPEELITEAATGKPDASLFAPRDNTLVPRAEPGSSLQSAGNRGKPARRALLWAAAELALAATLLYVFAGVGTRFFA